MRQKIVPILLALIVMGAVLGIAALMLIALGQDWEDALFWILAVGTVRAVSLENGSIDRKWLFVAAGVAVVVFIALGFIPESRDDDEAGRLAIEVDVWGESRVYTDNETFRREARRAISRLAGQSLRAADSFRDLEQHRALPERQVARAGLEAEISFRPDPRQGLIFED